MKRERLRALAFGFRAARALYAGVELGVFEALGERARGVDELARECAASERGLRLLLEALAALGVLERSEQRYRIHPELRGSLVPGQAAYLGNLFLHDLWHWTRWAALEESIRSGTPGTPLQGDRHLGDPAVLGRFFSNYNLAMEQSADEAPRRLAEHIAAHRPRRVIDLGGGTGALLLELCRRLPEAQAVLVEHDFALADARRRLAQAPEAARIELCALDFEQALPPGKADAIVLSRVLMGLPGERAQALIARAAAALAAGGGLYVHDFDAATRVGALLSLDMLLNTGGEVHPADRIVDWLAKAGLELEPVRSILSSTRLWTGRRP
jgi:precorrin-6B methylase 2